MRSFGGSTLAALQASTGERAFLIDMAFSSGTLYLTTASRDLLYGSQIYTAVGGNLQLGSLEESQDSKGFGVDIMLSGVDQAIIALLLSVGYRGQSVILRQAFLDPSLGTVISVIDLFAGAQLDNYEVSETVQRTGTANPTVTISTRARHRLSVSEFRGIRTNLHSHQRFYPGDTFFQYVPQLANEEVLWGSFTSPPILGNSDQSDYSQSYQ